MENGSKLMMLGVMVGLFAAAVLLTALMYYGVLDIAEAVENRQPIRSVMEANE